MSVLIAPTDPRTVGQPQAVFQILGLIDFDVHPDGARFVAIQRRASRDRGEIRVVLNWFAELRQRLPLSGRSAP